MRKYLLFIGVLIVGLASCSKDNGPTPPPFDEAAQAKIDDERIKVYLEEHPQITATKHSSGLYYQIIQEGTGANPTASSLVTVDYKGETIKGSVFDQGTYTTRLDLRGDVIDGWKVGLPLVKTGGTILLILPSRLAYGQVSPGPGIGANSVLIFTLKLKETK